MKRIKQVPVQVEKVVEKITEMKTTVVEEEGGLSALLGKRVMFHCMNYNYCGILSGVNTVDIELSDAQVVFETGPYTSKEPKVSEKLPKSLGIRLSSVEVYWEMP